MLDSHIQETLLTLYSHLGIPAEQVEFLEEADTLIINIAIPEQDAGIYIGRYAETLEAVQRITSSIVNNGKDVHQPVLVDIAGYRTRRKTKLEELASRLADEVKGSGTPRAFPSGLSATERRQLHLLFADDADLTTYSQGEGDYRRLYLAPKDGFGA